MKAGRKAWVSGASLGLVIGFVAQAQAATYQVGPGKTYTQLSQVANLLAPGDVVELDGDHTYNGGVAFWNAGQATHKITIRGIRINGQRPVLTGGNNTIEAAGNHYVFEGLDLTGGTSRCFYHHAHDIVLRDSVVHDCPMQGVLGADEDSGSLLMEYTEVHHCGGGTQQHQIYMATDETANPGAVFRMQYCYVHDANGGNGVKSRAQRNEIYYNWVEGSLYHELELIGPDGQDSSLAREDSDVVGNVLFKRNTFSVTRCGGDGTGYTEGRYRFVNNTVIVLPGASAVFRLFDRLESIEMHNNVFAVLGSGTVNLVRQVEAEWVTGSAIFAGSNNWVATGSSNVPSEWTGTLTGANPGFVDLSSNNVRPLQTGPLVNAGASSTSSPSGHPFPSPLAAPQWVPPQHSVQASGAAEARPSVGTIDIGAYEYGTSGTGGSAGSAGTGGSAGSGEGGSAGSGEGGSAGSGEGGSAGTAQGGSAGAGQGGAAGHAGMAGSSNGGGAGTAGGGHGGTDAGVPTDAGGEAGPGEQPAAEDDGGCGCRAPGRSSTASHAGWLLLALFAIRRRQRS